MPPSSAFEPGPGSGMQVFQGLQYRWRIAPAASLDAIEALDRFPPLIGQLLYLRGIRAPKEAADFLEIPLTAFEDPLLLPQVDVAIERLQRAKQRGEVVAVYGDFDADGVTGTALLVKAFRRFGLTVVAYIPHRVSEGHGLNEAAVTQLASMGVKLVVTVDCGVTDTAAVAHAGTLGVDTIITDHHLTKDQLPRALAVINPHAPHSEYPFHHLTGAGMALKLAQALLEPGLGEVWADDLMELAGIGTIADMAPLQGENRAIVAHGIEHLRRTRSTGLLALMRAARVVPVLADAEAIGFRIAPRLNAAGRLKHAEIAYELLDTDDAERADRLAEELNEYNSLRQALTQETLEQVRTLLPSVLPPVIVAGDAAFKPGVVGLAAGRLSEEYGVPAVVYGMDGDWVIASCRSGPGFHWGNALRACEDLLVRYGGHAHAAGFTCESGVLDVLKNRLESLAAEWGATSPQPLEPTIDAEATPVKLVGPAFQALRRMEPFGIGNPRPLFLARGARVHRVSPMGTADQHFRLTVRLDDALWDAIAFRQEWQSGIERVDIVYSLAVDRWDGRERLRLNIEDYAPAP